MCVCVWQNGLGLLQVMVRLRDIHITIQMKLIFLSVGAEPAVLGSAKTSLKFN